MKILTIIGTRPEFIRLSIIISKLNKFLGNDHVIVNTNQNFDDNLSKIFIESLYDENFKCKYNLNISGTFSQQLASLFTQLEEIIKKEKPDRFFVLGDTNSSMGGIIAKRMGIKVFHMEAGNRSFDEKTPEEVNRRIIDHCSDILMTYSQNSKRLLLNEGFRENQVFCVGNPIYEVMKWFENEINRSEILDDIPFIQKYDYYLCTLHRSENIDHVDRLFLFEDIIKKISNDKRTILIIHPHLRNNLNKLAISIPINIHCIDPVNFFDFIQLEKYADIIFTDSGTVQEECQILNRKCLVLRDSTERWETIENGSCIISGWNSKESILEKYEMLKNNDFPTFFNNTFLDYDIINEYNSLNVSDKVVKILLNNYLW